jgi:hypothetical protein
MLLAVLLIAGCALGAAVAFTKAGDTTTVVTVTDGVARGETITREDLTTTRVAGVDGAVPADQLEDLVGRTAVVDLLPGQVVVADASSSDPIPAEGETLVGAALEPSQVPDGLAAGDTVRVLAAPEEGADPDPDDAELANALVYTIDETELVGSGSGVRRVTLIVPDGDADAVALFASSDRIVLIETSSAGGGT